MVIQCTKTLLDKLHLEKEELVSPEAYIDAPDSLYAWHANLITIDRRKAIVFMNNMTKYAVVLYRPKAQDYKNLANRLKDGIKAAFTAEGIKTEIIEEYLSHLGENQYSKTAGRSLVANLNKVAEAVTWYADELDEEQLIQYRISLRMGKYLMKYNGEYKLPIEELSRGLCTMLKKPEDAWQSIYSVETYQLKIKINLKKFDIWRRIEIPANATFEELHHVIQRIFGWLDYHLHEFKVLNLKDSTKIEEPLYTYPIKIRIIDGKDPEGCDFLEPEKYEIRYDTKTILKDIFTENEMCIYTYDFGDDWDHIIRLEKVLTDRTNRFPVLLERKGNRPPEDVGGEGGFEDYMRIISNPEDKEYQAMLQWAKLTKEKEQTIEEINRWMKI